VSTQISLYHFPPKINKVKSIHKTSDSKSQATLGLSPQNSKKRVKSKILSIQNKKNLKNQFSYRIKSQTQKSKPLLKIQQFLLTNIIFVQNLVINASKNQTKNKVHFKYQACFEFDFQ